MAFKRYYATKDNTITNSFQENLKTRGTGSNMGQSDILETFYIYAQQSATSEEKARILLEFPVPNILLDRNNELLPESGSVSFGSIEKVLLHGMKKAETSIQTLIPSLTRVFLSVMKI